VVALLQPHESDCRRRFKFRKVRIRLIFQVRRPPLTLSEVPDVVTWDRRHGEKLLGYGQGGPIAVYRCALPG